MRRTGNASKMRKLNNKRVKNIKRTALDNIIAPEELKSAVKLEQMLRSIHQSVVDKDNDFKYNKDKAFQEAKSKRKQQRKSRKKNRK